MNTKPKHDPAPWRLCRDQSGWYIVPVEGMFPAGDVETGKDDDGRYLANALVATAAPELLHAAYCALAEITNHPCGHQEQYQRVERILRAAITKAEGAPAPAADGEDKHD